MFLWVVETLTKKAENHGPQLLEITNSITWIYLDTQPCLLALFPFPL